MKLENYLLILLILGSGSFLITFSAYADNLTISEGVILHYKYFRINSAEGKQISGDALFQIVTFDSSSLKVQISSKNAELRKMKFYIKFENGIPVYADRLEALIFLPSQCIAQSLEGNLDWITSIKTGTLANVTGKMCKTLNFTTEAGTYRCLNITLNLVGWEYGTLTLIYDINSGILVYEKWTPTYGDIIVQRLTAITSPRQMKQPLYNLILSVATITLPAAVFLHQLYKALRILIYKHEKLKFSIRSGFPRIPFYLTLIAGVIIFVSVFTPWSILVNLPIYLPYSLPSALAPLTEPLQTSLILVASSIIAHVAVLSAWTGIVLHIYTRKKLAAQITTTISAIMCITATLVFMQSQLRLMWGPLLAMLGGLLAIVAVAAANIRIEIVKETPETTVQSASDN